MTQNGIASHWYQVVVNEKTGWLWGGLIAIQSFDSSTDPSIKFVAGYENATYDPKTETYKCQYQIRAVSKNKQLDKLVLNTTDEIDSFENLGKKGLDQVDDILKGRTLCGNYDCIMQVTYIFWNNQQFYKVFELSETIDEGQLGRHDAEILSFPADPDGVANTIQKTTRSLEFVGIDEETKVYLETQKDFFIWNGTEIQSG